MTTSQKPLPPIWLAADGMTVIRAIENLGPIWSYWN